MSALLIQGGRVCDGVTRWMFYDELHAWLFARITEYGGPDLMRRLLQLQCSLPVRVHLASVLARLIMRGGEVRRLPVLSQRLQRMAERRAQYDQGLRMMQEALKDEL